MHALECHEVVDRIPVGHVLRVVVAEIDGFCVGWTNDAVAKREHAHLPVVLASGLIRHLLDDLSTILRAAHNREGKVRVACGELATLVRGSGIEYREEPVIGLGHALDVSHHS